jgi:hypothetical protein
MNTTTTRPRIIQELFEAGYRLGTPPHITHDTRAIDAQVCREMACPCGHFGMTYYPFKKGTAYVAVARCPDCHHQEEV